VMKKKRLTVVVDKNRCASSGNCAEIAGVVFTQDDATGVVILLQEHPDESQRELVKRAAAVCPAQAIVVKEE